MQSARHIRFSVILLLNIGLYSAAHAQVSVMQAYGSPCAGNEISFAKIGPGTITGWEIFGVNSELVGGGGTNSYINVKWNSAQSNAGVRVNTTSGSGVLYLTIHNSLTPTIYLETPPSNICKDEDVTFRAVTTNEGTNPNFKWYVDSKFNLVQNGPDNTYTTNTLSPGGHTIYVELYADLDCMNGTNPFEANTSITINTPASLSVSISDPGTVCGSTPWGTSVTAIGPGTLHYQWYVGDTPRDNKTGVPGYVFEPVTPVVNDNKVKCEVTSDASCVSPNPAWSDEITVQIQQPAVIEPNINISISDFSICSGDNIIFTASSTNSTLSDFQWAIDGSGTGSNAPSLTYPIYSGSTVVSVTAKATLNVPGCVQPVTKYKTATTFGMPITVTPKVTPSVTIASSDPDNSICSGAPVTFTASPHNGGSPTYSWRINGTQVSSGTSSTFTRSNLSDNNEISVVMTSTATCRTSDTAISNSITMNVDQVQSINIQSFDPGVPMCSTNPWGTSITATGPGTLHYQWYVGDTPRDNKTGVPGYVFEPVTPVVNNNKVKCEVTSDASCVSPNPAWSDEITVQIEQAQTITPEFGIEFSKNSICEGDELTFTAHSSNSALSNLQWTLDGYPKGTGTAFMTTEFTAGSTVSLDATATLDVTGCVEPDEITDVVSVSGAQITVSPVLTPTVTITASSDNVCKNSRITFTATPHDAGQGPTYSWYIDDLNSTPVQDESSNSYITDELTEGTHHVYVRLHTNTALGCVSPCEPAGVEVNIKELPGFTVEISPGSMLCPDDISGTFHAQIVNSSLSLTSSVYAWSSGGMSQECLYENLQEGQIIACDVSGTATNGCSSHSTGEYTVAFTPWTPALIDIQQPAVSTICAGESISVTASTNGNFIPNSIRWTYVGQTYTNFGPTFTANNYQQGDSISVEADVASSGTVCISPVTKSVSIIPPVTVNPLPDAAITPVGPRTICSTCAQTINASSGSGYNYQWLKNGISIPGATSGSYPASTAGDYSVSVTLNACSKTSDILFLTKNTRPVANAGADQTIMLPSKSTVLNGSATDADGTINTYQWTKLSGGPVTMSGATTQYLYLDDMNAGAYVFEFMATDDFGETSAADQVTVTVADIPNNYNWIKETVIKEKNTKDTSDVTDLQITLGEKAVSWSYFDGLGRPMQSVTERGSPSQKDIVQPIEYDAYGREAKKYLPYTGGTNGSFKPGAFNDQAAFYTDAGNNVVDDNYPYSITVFEPSPLNRVFEQGAPGEAWQLRADTLTNSGHTQRFEYMGNTDTAVLLLQVDTAGNLVNTGGDIAGGKSYYLPGQLYKNVVKNENWGSGELNTTEEYKDKQGQVVLKRSYVKVDRVVTAVETYYVYDDFGLLRYVIPPKASPLLTFPLNKGSTVIKELCYYYEYDQRKRMTAKQLPGTGPVYMVYDRRDRLVLAQDSVMRTDSSWLFTKYDELNRAALTGKLTPSTPHTRTEMQSFIDTIVYSGSTGRDYYVTRKTDSIDHLGYSNTSFPSTTDGAIEYYTATYYDDYDFPGRQAFNDTANVSGYSDSEGDPRYFEKLKNLVTGSKVRVLGTSDFLTATSYFDNKYRVIQTVRDLYDGTGTGMEAAGNKYTYFASGEIGQTRTIQAFAQNTTTVDKYYTYDHAGRLTRTEQEISGDGNGRITVDSLEYNELGQLMTKKLHAVNDTAYLQDIDYGYTIRGWLNNINDPSAPGDDLFSMQLLYNNAYLLENINEESQYNGNISGIIWNSQQDDTPGHYLKRAYSYKYDYLNRLFTTYYAEGDMLGSSPKFREYEYNYDLNGNILNLTRRDSSGNNIDEMDYFYENNGNSNKLKRIWDRASKQEGFIDNASNVDVDYGYDGNGNLTIDLNKKISSITYNYLNLPSVVTKDTNNSVTYVYDATGVKLMQATKLSGTTATRYYTGLMEYGDSNGSKELSLIHMDEGIVTTTSTGYCYEYYLKDHLGNVRVTFTPGTSGHPVLTQRTDYYPFGMKFGDQYNSATGNGYLYNGKELQNEMGLEWYDYGARMYDPALGRFMVQDAFAENYFDFTPYQYTLNNPIKHIDIEGHFVLPENFIKDYPELADYLKNTIQDIANNSKIMNNLQFYGDLSRDQIISDLQWDNGPTIDFRDLGGVAGRHSSKEPNVLQLNNDMLLNLKNASTKEETQIALFLIAVEILHEYVHYGDYKKDGKYKDEKWSKCAGTAFEIYTYGKDIDNLEDANEVMNKDSNRKGSQNNNNKENQNNSNDSRNDTRSSNRTTDQFYSKEFLDWWYSY